MPRIRRNRKQRKKRKMQLKRMGLEAFTPDPYSIMNTSPDNFPYKIAKHFKGNAIMCGKMRGYEFTRILTKQKNETNKPKTKIT